MWYCTSNKQSENSCFEDGEFNFLKQGTFLIITWTASFSGETARFSYDRSQLHEEVFWTTLLCHSFQIFLDTVIYKGEIFKEHATLGINTHFKPTEIFQYVHYSSCHPPSAKIGFVKGETLRVLRINYWQSTFEVNKWNFKTGLLVRGYRHNLIVKYYRK